MPRWDPSCWSWLIGGVLAVAGCADGTGREVAHYAVALDAERLDELTFSQDAGDLAVRGDPDRRSVHVEAWLRAGFGAVGRDEAARERVDIRLDEPAEGSGELGFLDRGLPAGYYLDLELVVPSGLALTIGDDSGDLTVTDVAALVVNDDSGDVAIEGIAGSVRVTDGSGDLSIVDVVGDVRVDDDSGDVTIARVDGDVAVTDGSSDVTIDAVGGDVSVDDDSGDVAITHVDGDVVVRDGSGDVTVVDAGRVEVAEDGSGDVSID